MSLRSRAANAAGPRQRVDLSTLLTVDSPQSRRQITADGELDFFAAPALHDAVTDLVRHNPGDSAIDLAGITFIDAGGIGCVVACRNALATIGATLIVVGASPRVRKVFDIVGLDALLTES